MQNIDQRGQLDREAASMLMSVQGKRDGYQSDMRNPKLTRMYRCFGTALCRVDEQRPMSDALVDRGRPHGKEPRQQSSVFVILFGPKHVDDDSTSSLHQQASEA